jgi:ATP-dependent Clp protease protease subunit
MILTPIDDRIARAAREDLERMISSDSRRPVTVLVNSPGGFVDESCRLAEFMLALPAPIRTCCLRSAQGTATLLVACGTRGMRHCLRDASLGFQPVTRGSSTSGPSGRSELDAAQDQWADVLARTTGKPIPELQSDLRRALQFDPDAAVRYGLLDSVVGSLEALGVPLRP